jgi:hypothetical protein
MRKTPGLLATSPESTGRDSPKYDIKTFCVNQMRTRQAESERHPGKASGAGVEGLFESLLHESFRN